MAANMWENSLKNVESDNNKTLYKTLVNFFTGKQYFFNKPHICFQTVCNDTTHQQPFTWSCLKTNKRGFLGNTRCY